MASYECVRPPLHHPGCFLLTGPLAPSSYEDVNEQYDDTAQDDAYAYEAAPPPAVAPAPPPAPPAPAAAPVELEPTELDAYGNPIDPSIMPSPEPAPPPPPPPPPPAPPVATESVMEAMQRLEAQLGL